MANSYKILGQLNPAPTTEDILYLVPTPASAVCSSIVICNWGTADTTFRVSLSYNLVPTDVKDYLYYDVAIAGITYLVAMSL